ncbi:MAG: nonstructural protein [Bacteroidetes bacterium]|jgi:hypothetical protein|nr:nonstructural protein [Bacteroidota bacterium]
MLQKLFTVYDSKAENYSNPVYLASTGLAVRTFSDSVQDPESPFAKHPADYTLFELGTYDDQTAKMELLPTPKSLFVAIDFINQENDQ